MTISHAKTHFTGADGNTLVATLYGGVSDHVALLLHGGGQTRHSWHKTALNLAAQGFTAIAVDLRGHGESEWVKDKAYTFDRFGNDVEALAAEIKSRFGCKPIAIGASLGGISSLIAQHQSGGSALAALVLVDITPRMNPEGVAKIQGFMTAQVHNGFATVEEASDAIAAYLPHRKRPKSLDGLRKNLRHCEDGRWRWHWDPAFVNGPMSIRTAQQGAQAKLLDAASSLTIPTLLVRGGRSELVSEEHVAEFLELVPHAQYADVSDAGHMVAGDRNDVFSDAVLTFMNQIIIPISDNVLQSDQDKHSFSAENS